MFNFFFTRIKISDFAKLWFCQGGNLRIIVSLNASFSFKVEVKTKMLEAKFHEEKLRLQQKHDAAVQKASWGQFFLYSYLSTALRFI